ncbi:Ribose 1,5-bisphosphate phosphokinase PhnN [Marinomonas spartinae]|uniref:Ribose 1,5-bisphosphate phosphokinase PhnN n=1 Tax=Marinomonas spartinae TaxID=1792290 RepID=A0A1A8TMR5_9GAMM|nr:ribose 1,5-bisphosphokinase [Marinomonas spartinae]SBS34201.1 Ribose 1,5-bisphosphate phosphokinase PhnN [Marinomonas spartinae]
MKKTSKILYLIGASGSGKDSIISALRQHIDVSQARPNLMVTHRYICRDWHSGSENHIQLSEKEFCQRKQLGLFALDWQANGLRYGIGREIDLWLAQGQTVIVNGSRGYLPTARALYPEQLMPVLITVDEATLRQRLIDRGRESLDDIDSRIIRNQQLMREQKLLADCYRIDNSTQIDHAVKQLMAYINRLLDHH